MRQSPSSFKGLTSSCSETVCCTLMSVFSDIISVNSLDSSLGWAPCCRGFWPSESCVSQKEEVTAMTVVTTPHNAKFFDSTIFWIFLATGTIYISILLSIRLPTVSKCVKSFSNDYSDPEWFECQEHSWLKFDKICINAIKCTSGVLFGQNKVSPSSSQPTQNIAFLSTGRSNTLTDLLSRPTWSQWAIHFGTESLIWKSWQYVVWLGRPGMVNWSFAIPIQKCSSPSGHNTSGTGRSVVVVSRKLCGHGEASFASTHLAYRQNIWALVQPRIAFRPTSYTHISHEIWFGQKELQTLEHTDVIRSHQLLLFRAGQQRQPARPRTASVPL